MQTTVTIPSASRDQEVLAIVLVPGTTLVNVTIRDEVKRIQRIQVDIADEWTAASVDTKTTIKNFLKGIAAKAFDLFNEPDGIDVTAGDITGEVWE